MGAHWVETAARHWRHGRIVGHRFAEAGSRHPRGARAAKPGSALLAGNSHAELVGTPDLGGRRCINIAVGGSTAADRGRHLAALRVPVALRGRGADHRHQRHPALAASRAGPGGRPVRGRCPGDPVRSLEAWAAQVLVAAVPPIGADATGRDPAAVAVFSDRLAALCAAGGARRLRPVRGVARPAPGALAGPGLHRGRRASGRLRAPGGGARPRGGDRHRGDRRGLARARPEARCGNAPAGPARGPDRPAVRAPRAPRRGPAAARARRRAAPAPAVWPADEAAWLDENGVRHPRAARRTSRRWRRSGPAAGTRARIEGGGKVVTGPASALILRDAEAEIGFVLGLTPDGYGAEPF
ncbi:SGNH/GDSL hydrolase family protein [Methylobacterium oryzae CBMB20]